MQSGHADLVTLAVYAQTHEVKRVLILAHENASNEALVLVIDASGQAGIKDVSVAEIQPAGVSPAPAGGTPPVIKRN